MPHAASFSATPHAALADVREQAFRLLTDRFAEEAISVEEFERRLDRIHAATTPAETRAVVADLEQTRAAMPSPAWPAAPAAGGYDVRHGARHDASKRLLAIMGATRRTGAWQVPERLAIRAIMSEVVLDLRDAYLPPGEVTLDLVALMTTVHLLVPPELAVEDALGAVMSEVRNASAGPSPALATRRLRLTGTAVMAAVEIRSAPRGLPTREAWKEARRRR